MILQKFSANWINDFNAIKAELENSLDGLACTIEHVGSTAVANLDAKPIIDIDIVYTEPPGFEKIKSALEHIGYYHNGNQGVADREVFKRNTIRFHEILDRIDHHLYVCPVNSKALERHILSRNFLRKNDWARQQYQQMKYELAEQAGQDRKRYAALKEMHVNDLVDFMVDEEKKSNQ